MKQMITFGLLIFSLQVNAQRVYGSASGEYTITGLQYGLSFGYAGKKGFQAGFFYQQGYKKTDTWPSVSPTFYGIESILPITKSDKILVGGHLRAGVADQQFFVIVPSIVTLIKIYNKLQVGLALSWRYGNPAIGARLQFKL